MLLLQHDIQFSRHLCSPIRDQWRKLYASVPCSSLKRQVLLSKCILTLQLYCSANKAKWGTFIANASLHRISLERYDDEGKGNAGQEWEWKRHCLSDVCLIGWYIKKKAKLSQFPVSFKKMPVLDKVMTLLELPSPHADVPKGNSSTVGIPTVNETGP